MPSTASLISKLSKDFPSVSFSASDSFYWSSKEKTIFYVPDADNAESLIFHELGHALLGHSDYQKDVALLGMESDAWEKGLEVALANNVLIEDSFVQEHLDTYRDWMHARSTCPTCGATGFQASRSEYSCPACFQKWRVNEARACGLKRYKI